MSDRTECRSTSSVGVFAFALALILWAPALRAQGQPTTGPDVTVNLLGDIANYGNTGGLLGYMVGTTSCNIGDAPVNWCDNFPGGCSGLTPAQHPVIAQGVYRLKDGRLDQVGMSWLKHGFVSTNSTEGICKQGSGCTSPPLGGNQLGVGCRDTYWATLNAGAQYWIEGQYVSDNDALAGNGLNNASYRGVTVAAGSFNLTLAGPVGTIVKERTALHAWKAADAAVELFNVDVPGALVERFEVARKVTVVDGDTWHYEYAIRNMNSDRSARAFTVDFADNTPIANVGFKDVEHHSGEPYSTTDWIPVVTAATGTVQWSTSTFATDANANAMRWATMFNFWFDADAAPGTASHTIELFKPGTPATASWVMSLFSDGFESHNTTTWSASVP